MCRTSRFRKRGCWGERERKRREKKWRTGRKRESKMRAVERKKRTRLNTGGSGGAATISRVKVEDVSEQRDTGREETK